MYKIIEGKDHALKIREEIRNRIGGMAGAAGRPPKLEVIIAGSDPASLYYASLIKKAGAKEGIEAVLNHMKSPDEYKVLEKIENLNRDETVDGILIQLPLPPPLNKEKIINAINPLKDIDGQHPVNLGKLISGQKGIFPATARAVLKIIKLNGIEVSGKRTVVVGRSTAVGLPAAIMLVRENAAVSVCHSKTAPLEEFTSEAEILVVSAGKPKLISENHVKKGACVIDVGTNEVEGEMVGDVDFERIIRKASVSPVRGGVGALTMACILENTFNAYKKNIHGNGTQ